MEFHISLNRVGSLEYSCGIVIAYFCLTVRNFVLASFSNVSVVIFDNCEFKVQNHLVEKYYLVGLCHSNGIFVDSFFSVFVFGESNLQFLNSFVGF